MGELTTEFTVWSTRSSFNQEAEASTCLSEAAGLRRISISSIGTLTEVLISKDLFQEGPDDIAGIAVAHSSISQDFSNAQVLQGNPSFSSETVLEATYNFSIAPWWTLQPDFQYIWTPSAQNGSNNAAVLGIRTTITF